MAKIQCNVISYTLQRTVDITIILPTVTIPESLFEKGKIHHEYPEKLPVLYLLHGYGNNHAQWSGYTGVELYAEERKIAVVMISGENKRYLSNAEDDFETFIQKELQEFITNTFPISKRKEDTYIAGLSMGGYGALYHGLTTSDQYQAIGAFSPAIEMESTPISLFDVIEKTKTAPPIYIACGENDFLYEQNTAFVERLIEKGYEHTWLSVPEFQHEWRFWDQQVEAFLDWIPRTDYYKGTKRSV